MMRIALIGLVVLAAAGLPVQSQQFEEPTVHDRYFPLVMNGFTFNGLKQPDTLMLEATEGENLFFAVTVPITAEPHVFHLHGHPWWDNGEARFIDAKLLMAGDVHTFNVTAGAPGDWMYHCHFDLHFAQGMWGVLRIHPAGGVGTDNPGHAAASERKGIELPASPLDVA